MFKLGRNKKPKARKKPKAPTSILLKRQILIGCILFVVIALLITAVWYVTRLSSLQVREVKVVGGFTISHDNIENIAKNNLKGTYFKLIPKRFSFFYPDNKIEAEILRIDRIKNVHVELDESNDVLIAFEEHKPYALWCGEVDSEECIFMDDHGYAFAKAPSLTGSAFVRYVGSNVEPAIGEQYFSQEFIDETKSFIQMLEDELSLYTTRVQTFGDYDIEYFISGGGRIKVSQTMSMETSFNNLKTILNSDAFIHIEPGTFQYIDLRFGDKVFVNEELPNQQATSTASSSEEDI